MRQAHANKSHDFNVKHDAGGLIDVEFVVQYLVLGHSQKHLELTKNLGNIALLNIAAQLGLLPTHIAQNAANAYRTLRAKQHRLRLNELGKTIPHAQVAQAIEAIQALWAYCFESDA